jgi:hypothetical protein
MFKKERADHQEKIVEQATSIRNLQLHISYLEKQLARAVNLNPALGDDLNSREAGVP